MARIPESEIERLKADVSVQRLVEARGIALTRHGADWLGRCPFHDDKTPSLVVSPSKNLWHCLGACQTGGTAIDWVMKAEGVSFRHAVELLREGLPAVSASDRVVRLSTVPKLPAPVSSNADDRALLHQVIDYYHDTLKQSPEAVAYLQSRGLNHPELIERFRLGFANRTLGLRLPDKNRKAGADIRTRLQALGLVRDSGHEHFNGSLVIPVVDEHGDVTEIYGRKITPNLRSGTPLHLYLPGPHRGLWNVEAVQTNREIILCEALIDAMTFWCAGYRNVTAAYGVEGFTADHLAAFKQYGIERVLIAYDRDAAGDAAAEKLASKLMAAGIACYRCRFPHGLDANAYALKVTPASQSLGVVIRSATWIGNGVPAPITTHAATHEAAADAPPLDATPSPSPALDPTPEPLPVLAASPLPVAAPPLPVEVDERELRVTLDDRAYVVRGIEKNSGYEQLKVWIKVQRATYLHIDTVELYAARQRQGWCRQASIELGVSEEAMKGDLAQLLRAVELRQDELIRARQAPKTTTASAPELSAEQQDAALALLRDPALVDRIKADVAALGVVGEDHTALVGYLACVSRRLDKPLAILIQSTSAAGKSTVMDALLSLMPEEQRVHYSAMTGQSLFYLGEGDLTHKILAIAEEEGVRQAAYALKLLQSQGELTMASTGKDPATGKLVTEEYRVEGPVMLFLTTTAIDIDEELLNRCLVLTINESREQTEAIHRRQRQGRTLDGLLATQTSAAIRTLHQNAQRLLRPLAVVNPYAEQLTFRSESPRLRRDHAKYLTLIDAIAFLHQHQRPIRHAGTIAYIEVTRDDIALANRLAGDVLGRSLDDLPPQTRQVLGEVVAYVDACEQAQNVARSQVRFTRRDLREATPRGDTQLKLHLARLEDHEYLIVHRTGTRFHYELLFSGDLDGAHRQLIGLVDVDTLVTPTTADRSEEIRDRSASGRVAVGAVSGGDRPPVIAVPPSAEADLPSLVATLPMTAPRRSDTSPVHRNGVATRPMRGG
jgi:DNA primase catalytic core